MIRRKPKKPKTVIVAINKRGAAVGKTTVKQMIQSCILFVLLLCSTVYGADTYTIQTITYPGAVFHTLSGVNNNGQIVGDYTIDTGTGPQGFKTTSFVYEGGLFAPFTAPTGTSSPALLGINDKGLIVGVINSQGEDVGLIWRPKKNAKVNKGNIDMFEVGLPEAFQTQPMGINNNNVIAGVFWDNPLNSQQHCFVRVGEQDFKIDITGALVTTCTGINDRNEKVGWYYVDGETHHGFVTEPGKPSPTKLDCPGMAGTGAFGLNNDGQVVGYCWDSNFIFKAYVWTAATGFQFIPIIGAQDVVALGINDNGIIVGYYSDRSTGKYLEKGFIATPQTVVADSKTKKK